MELQREVTLRQSVEDAHEALLMRIRDMEEIVDSERGQVNDLVDNWDNAKRQAEATKEAFENEHDLRTHLEGLVTQHEEEFGKNIFCLFLDMLLVGRIHKKSLTGS